MVPKRREAPGQSGGRPALPDPQLWGSLVAQTVTLGPDYVVVPIWFLAVSWFGTIVVVISGWKFRSLFGAWRDVNQYLIMEVGQEGEFHKFRKFGLAERCEEAGLNTYSVNLRDKDTGEFMPALMSFNEEDLFARPYQAKRMDLKLVQSYFALCFMQVTLIPVIHPKETEIRTREPLDFIGKFYRFLAACLVPVIIGGIALLYWYLRDRRDPPTKRGHFQWRITYLPDRDRLCQVIKMTYYDLTINEKTNRRVRFGTKKERLVDLSEYMLMMKDDGVTIQVVEKAYSDDKGRPLTRRESFASRNMSIGLAPSPHMVSMQKTQMIVDLKDVIRKNTEVVKDAVRKNSVMAHIGTAEFRELHLFVLRNAVLNRVNLIQLYGKALKVDSEDKFWAAYEAHMRPLKGDTQLEMIAKELQALREMGIEPPQDLERAAQRLSAEYPLRGGSSGNLPSSEALDAVRQVVREEMESKKKRRWWRRG